MWEGHATRADIARLEEKIDGLIVLIGRLTIMSTTLQTDITALTQQVTNTEAGEQSAIALINGIPALIAQAVNQALAAGAPPAALMALNNLATSLGNNASQLAAAVMAAPPLPVSSGTSGTSSGTGGTTGAGSGGVVSGGTTNSGIVSSGGASAPTSSGFTTVTSGGTATSGGVASGGTASGTTTS